MVIQEQSSPAIMDELVITAGSSTAAGGRPENEDAVLVVELPPSGDGVSRLDAGYLVAVADGMGGHQRGEVASRLAIETIARVVQEDPGADTALLLKQAFRRANEVIHQDSQGVDAAATMGTTLVAAVIRGKYLAIANVGDSRAYLSRANQLNQITRDHSLVGEQMSQGTLSADEAKKSPNRNILMHALGHRPKLDSKLPDIFELVLLAEDRLLLCSDGFYDVVSEEDFVTFLATRSPEEAAAALVDVALERGTTDNVSAVVVHVEAAKTVAARDRELVTGDERRSSQVVILVVLVGVLFFVAIVVAALMLL